MQSLYHGPYAFFKLVVIGDLWCIHTERNQNRDRSRDWGHYNGGQYVPAPVSVQVQCESFHTVSYNPFILGHSPCLGSCQCEYTISALRIKEKRTPKVPHCKRNVCRTYLPSFLSHQTIVALLYNFLPDVNQLVIYSTLAVQLKILLAMTAFYVLRWKQPNLHRPVKVINIISFSYQLLLFN